MPFFLSGSRPDQLKQAENVKNPLPPCPDSPNCVRLSKGFSRPPAQLFESARKALRQMGPVGLRMESESRQIDAVFKIFIYKDDFAVQTEATDESSGFVHIRSSSRTGYSDLGVNRRRVKRFLRLLKKQLGMMNDDLKNI